MQKWLGFAWPAHLNQRQSTAASLQRQVESAEAVDGGHHSLADLSVLARGESCSTYEFWDAIVSNLISIE